jgi:lipopolysaccharide/colanic/teichoic acid biosynthesis glycosyltransferase
MSSLGIHHPRMRFEGLGQRIDSFLEPMNGCEKEEADESLHARGEGCYELLKRAFDLALALFLIALLSPILSAVAFLVYLDSAGAALFCQERVGRHGRLFKIYKFRTMYAGSPAYEISPMSSADPRITRIGRFLRRTSIDELPQLLNVIKGEMSLVGPRPEMPFVVNQYNSEQRRRLAVAPGMTGLWQLSAGRGHQIHDNIHYDLYYARHRSFSMDLAILLRTPALAMRGI